MIDIQLDKGAFAPKKAHKDDAGYDLFSPVSAVLVPGNHVNIDTGVHMEIPEGYCGLLVSKSGLNVRNGITGTGLIDSGYTGSIVVRLDCVNEPSAPHKFERGDKLIQIVILPYLSEELNVVPKLKDKDRGDNGFGSSGR